MAKLKNITELDLGETLIIQGEKVHVNIDGVTIVTENGKLKAVLPPDSPITKFELSPTGTLSLGVKGVDQPFTVDLTGLVPAAQADRFLSGVTFNKTKKAFVFTTSKDGEKDQKFEVPLSAFLDEVLKISSAEGNILELREDGFYVACCGGGADLGNVPEKPFEQGSKVLAFDADGNLYQFAQNAAYEKDVAVSIEVVSNQILDDGKNVAEVRVIVSNNLHTQADDVQLNVGTAATVDSGELSPAKFTLDGNSRKVFTYSVSYDTSSYITASVSAVGDLVSSNNSTSVVLPFNVRQVAQSESNVFTRECPLVQATYNGEVLVAAQQVSNPSDSNYNSDRSFAKNIIADVSKPNLAGVTINLLGASRVQVYSFEHEGYSLVSRGGNRGRSNGYFAIKEVEGGYHSFLLSIEDIWKEQINDYTFDVESGDLTFNSDIKISTAMIFLRPGGEDCLWQPYIVMCNGLATTVTEQVIKLATSTLPENVVSYEDTQSTYIVNGENVTPVKQFNELPAITPDVNVKFIGDVEGAKTTESLWHWDIQTMRPFINNSQKASNKRLVVKLCPQNLPVTFEVTTSEQLPLTQGNVSVARKGSSNTYTVTVLEGATATDNYINNTFKLILDECSDVVSGTYTPREETPAIGAPIGP